MADFYNTMTASKEFFASIKCPVLVMAGELDRNAPLPTVINTYYMIPKSQLSIIPNAVMSFSWKTWQRFMQAWFHFWINKLSEYPD